MSDEQDNMFAADGEIISAYEAEALAANEREAEKTIGANSYFRGMFDRNYLEYAAYTIKDRAIPNVDDGLKPVQRRILWAMHRIDDGRTHKAAFVVGEVMGKYHPHGDASIAGALVVLANKEYFIKKQGNFGNIFTGSSAAAVRYIECGLSDLGREVMFNDDITELVDTYDGRNREPVVLPVKIPALLMLGSDGIAAGMATKILPHNFNEVIQAQIAELEGRRFELYPDFQQGGLMDVSEYADGNGRIVLRARIEIKDRKLYIREIPATTTTESLIASIEREAEKGRIKIASVNDYTTKEVEIEVVPTRGYDPEKAMNALYMYTDCSVSISPNLTVIRDNRPAVMSVTEVIKRNTVKLLEHLKHELEIDLDRQNELHHAKTLAQIFFENRIYKRIEECRSQRDEYAEVHAGLAPFRNLLRRDVTDEDVDKLLALPVRRISRFDIEKNQQELREIEKKISAIRKHLADLKGYAKEYLNALLNKYGSMFPRRTEIEKLEKIDRKAAALSNIRVYWDRKNCYIGTSVKSDDFVMVNEFDQLLCVERSGRYKIINTPDKIFIDRLFEFRKQDAQTEFGVIYRDVKSGKCYGKRSSIAKFITDREYNLCPPKCRLELLTPCPNAIYSLKSEAKKPAGELNLMTLPRRSAKARGILIGGSIAKLSFSRYLTDEELAAAAAAAAVEETEAEEVETAIGETMEPETAAQPEPAVIEAAPEPENEVAAKPAVEPEPTPPRRVRERKKAEVKTAPEPRKTEAETEPAAPEEKAELLPLPEPEPAPMKKPAKPRVRKPKPEPAEDAKKPEAPEAPRAGEERKDDDDFGIVQPEFGF